MTRRAANCRWRSCSAIALEAFPCEFEDLPDGAKRRRVSSKQVEALEQKLGDRKSVV